MNEIARFPTSADPSKVVVVILATSLESVSPRDMEILKEFADTIQKALSPKNKQVRSRVWYKASSEPLALQLKGEGRRSG